MNLTTYRPTPYNITYQSNFTAKYKITKTGTILDFQCPSLESLSTPPENCQPEIQPVQTDPQPSIMGIYQPGHPGPSEQTYALKELVTLAFQLNRAIAISPFTTHRSDRLSNTLYEYPSSYRASRRKKCDSCHVLKKVPFGARVDMNELCKLIPIVYPDDQIKTIVNIYEKDWQMEKNKKPAIDYTRKFMNETDFDNVTWYQMHAQKFSFIPKDNHDSVKMFFSNNSLTEEKTTIAVAHAYNWIYRHVWRMIDAGGIYRIMHAIEGSAIPPNYTDQVAEMMYNVDQKLLRKVFRATAHPKFIRDLAQIFMRDVFGTDVEGKVGLKEQHNFAGVHFRFNPGDFFSSKFLENNETEAHGNHMPVWIGKHVYRALTGSWKFMIFIY